MPGNWHEDRLGGRISDPDDPDEAFDLDLKAMLAVRESGVTRKRIRRDVVARADTGRPHGRLPYGFIRHYDPTTGALIRQAPDPSVSGAVLDAARRFMAGAALYTLARELTEQCVPRPHELRARRLNQAAPEPDPWTPLEVRRVISSPTTAGIRMHNGEEKALGAWEPIIPVELHRQIVTKLNDPGRRTVRDGATRTLCWRRQGRSWSG